MMRVTKTGHIIPRNSNHINTKPITAEQHLRDHFTQHKEDPLDKLLKQYETFSPYWVPNNEKNRRREEIDMNNHNDTQTSSTQDRL